VEAAAQGIVELTEAKMAATIEEITIGKGYDPREFTLVAYGGGGPLVVSSLADRLEIPCAVVPVAPATFSAWGMLTLDVVHDRALTQVVPLEALDGATIAETVDRLAREANADLQGEGISEGGRELHVSVDLRYEGQEHTLPVPLRAGEPFDLELLRQEFDRRHEQTYGYSTSAPVELVACRIRAVGRLPKPARPTLPRSQAGIDTALKGMRAALRADGEVGSVAVYDRTLLGAGDAIEGPALIEEPTATTVVGEGRRARVDPAGNLLVECVA
jgi:N-methylhydantoinase A